jgi:hypothetical protein
MPSAPRAKTSRRTRRLVSGEVPVMTAPAESGGGGPELALRASGISTASKLRVP